MQAYTVQTEKYYNYFSIKCTVQTVTRRPLLKDDAAGALGNEFDTLTTWLEQCIWLHRENGGILLAS